MSKRFLITGASGFVGSCLLRRLAANGEEVHILTRQESNKWRIVDILDHIKEHQVDLRDRSTLLKVLSEIRPDIIYHCAAYGARPFQHDPFKSAEVNLMGTVNLVEALMKIGYESLIHTGSSAEYGKKDKLMTEQDLLEPNTVYGATKAAASLFCQATARSKRQPILILRLMSPYGPYDEPKRLIPAVIRKCLAGEDPELSSGEQSRSFFFIEDLIDLYLQVPFSQWSPGEIVNVGPEGQYSVRDIATKIIKLTGASVQPLLGALPPREFDTDYWLADMTKVKSIFGWTPKIDIDEGLRRTIEWYDTFTENPQ